MQVRIADNEVSDAIPQSDRTSTLTPGQQQKVHKRQQRTGLVSGARSSESLNRGTSK
jgi:hypothetical protein